MVRERKKTEKERKRGREWNECVMREKKTEREREKKTEKERKKEREGVKCMCDERERERERKTKKERERRRNREKENDCVLMVRGQEIYLQCNTANL